MVVQEDDYGCGVACVANLLNIKYDSALALFAEPKNAECSGYFCRDIVSALAKAGIKSKYKYIKLRYKTKIYKPGTIVFIKRDLNYPAGHYLFRLENGWADSWINFPSYPRFGGIRKKLPGQPTYFIIAARQHLANQSQN